ncbi:MAG: OmpA family protein [Aliarcobacter sp.]|nr:OmpA family protein [Aliarcobacter sp.]
MSSNNLVSFDEKANFEEKNIIDEINLLKNRVLDSFNEKETKPFSLVLIKKDGVVEMNGLFSSENDAKKVSDILNINREGEFKYEEDRVIDDYLLEEISILMPSFKDFFADNSKLTISNNEVSLSGQLKDANYKDLLDSILSRIKIDLKTEIIVPEVVALTEINKPIDENPVLSDKINLVTEDSNVISDTKASKTNQASNISSKLNEVQLSINNILSTKKINFERRSTQITPDSKVVTEEIAKILNDNPTFRIEVAGHTDSRGSDSLNKQISQDRASSVRDVLISFGVDKDRITAVGYGEEFPIAKDDENGLSEINRRVEFNILGE